MKIKLRTKIGGLVALLIVAILFVGGASYLGIRTLDEKMDDIANVQLPAVRNMSMADMMHDGLRAVVFEAILAAEAGDANHMTAVQEELKEFSMNFRAYLGALDELPLHGETKDAIAKVKPQLDAYLAGAEKMVTLTSSGRLDEARAELAAFAVIYKNLEVEMETLGELIESDAKEAQEQGDIAAERVKSLTLIFIAVAAVVGALLGIFLTLGITRALNRIIEALNAGSDQVASASEQTASSSQSVAQSAAEMAASLEETSSSIEELTSMIGQNADHAGQANQLMKSTRATVEHANGAMTEMQAGMNDIKKNSDDISKIIKVIEEIAFQTNLLALNAAVEAARAGEHGKGFAVVAEEVRNLAQRAGASARDTGGLIDRAVRNVNDGLVKVSGVAKGLKEITESSIKVGNLVEEIANASREQSQGISQINTAVSEMDQTTQGVAANSEETAAAAEQMSSQAVGMRENVRTLVALVEGVA